MYKIFIEIVVLNDIFGAKCQLFSPLCQNTQYNNILFVQNTKNTKYCVFGVDTTIYMCYTYKAPQPTGYCALSVRVTKCS